MGHTLGRAPRLRRIPRAASRRGGADRCGRSACAPPAAAASPLRDPRCGPPGSLDERLEHWRVPASVRIVAAGGHRQRAPSTVADPARLRRPAPLPSSPRLRHAGAPGDRARPVCTRWVRSRRARSAPPPACPFAGRVSSCVRSRGGAPAPRGDGHHAHLPAPDPPSAAQRIAAGRVRQTPPPARLRGGAVDPDAAVALDDRLALPSCEPTSAARAGRRRDGSRCGRAASRRRTSSSARAIACAGAPRGAAQPERRQWPRRRRPDAARGRRPRPGRRRRALQLSACTR